MQAAAESAAALRRRLEAQLAAAQAERKVLAERKVSLEKSANQTSPKVAPTPHVSHIHIK